MLLLHGDLNFTDSETTPKTVTPVAGASITANGVFSESSLLLNGSTDYLTIPDSKQWDLGTGKFTIDAWVKFNPLPSNGTDGMIIAMFPSAANYWLFGMYNNAGQYRWHFVFEVSSSQVLEFFANDTPVPNVWYHIAVVRNGTTAADWYIFKDGVQLEKSGLSGNYNASAPSTTGTVYIGQLGNTNSFFPGQIAELRVTKGKARWTANFTPPTTAYTDDTGKALTSVDITGLNGDTDMQYEIIARIVNAKAGGAVNYIRCNNDSGANYGDQVLGGNSTNVSASRTTSYTGLYYASSNNIDDVSFSRVLLNAKSGYVRTGICTDAECIVGSSVYSIITKGLVWNNTADNITSLTITTDQVQALGVGSSIEVYARRG
jgi:hypothetical protein